MSEHICEKNLHKNNSKENIVDYYTCTSPDYKDWSKDFNMHFGYFRFKNWAQCLNEIWRLEPQLKQANSELFNNLGIKKNGHYLDMGCGFGATGRDFSPAFPDAKLTGITLVESQVIQASKLLKQIRPSAQNVDFQQMDFQNTTFESEKFDGVYAMESACHGKGESRREFLAEAYRILKPHGTIVIHDAFILKAPSQFNIVYRYAYHWLCKGWAVESYINKDKFEAELKHQGFKDIHFKNIFWHVLPSALHIPRVVIMYAFKKMLFSKDFYKDTKLRKQRINHWLGSIAAIFVPLHTKRFGYYIVTAKK